jgi:allantoinase
MSGRLVVRARRAALPEGIAPAALLVEDGVIRAVAAVDARFEGAVELDAGEATLLPGLVDAHVHANEPGRTHWEGFATATRAAAAGGVTTLVDMPLNSLPPTTSVAALEAKRDAARSGVWIDVAFWGGAVPGNEAELGRLHAAGVCGVKGFLADAGVPEFPPLDEADLEGAMAACARNGITLLVHAELPGPLGATPPGRSYAGWLAARPAAAEVEAIALLVRLSRRFAAAGATPRVHVVHLSAAAGLPLVAGARAEGLPFSAETCPHYLVLEAEGVADGATLCKCAPPIRDAANRERLWAGLEAGTIEVVASDHSPSPPEGKALDDGDFARAWGGIASLGLGLPVVWSEASRRGHDLAGVARWMASAPARLAGLDGPKGALAPGKDADFVLFDPDEEWTVDPERLWTRHRITPYAGRRVRGRVRATYLRGERVYAGGRFEGTPRGRLRVRGEAAG